MTIKFFSASLRLVNLNKLYKNLEYEKLCAFQRYQAGVNFIKLFGAIFAPK